VLKTLALKVLCNTRVNSIVRILLKPIATYIPQSITLHVPVAGKVSMKLPNGKKMMLAATPDESILWQALWQGFKGFESETAKIFTTLAGKSETILDIGANVGYYSLLAAITNRQAKVFAFEPVPEVYERLRRNIELNGLSNVDTSTSAVTNFDGQTTLYIPVGTMPVSASTLKGFRDAGEELQVPAITLDTFVVQNAISRVDLMKVDTEATEHMVLEGGLNLIRRDEPLIICEVLKGRTEKFLHELLSPLEYNYYWITEQGLIQKETIEGDGTYVYRNYLFCKGEKLRKYGLR